MDKITKITFFLNLPRMSLDRDKKFTLYIVCSTIYNIGNTIISSVTILAITREFYEDVGGFFIIFFQFFRSNTL